MHAEVLVVGGGVAGLSAATLLSRARRRVVVVDAGAPRNRFSTHAHNILGHDGRSGADILSDARSQLARYPTAELWQGEVASLREASGAFETTLADGRTLTAERVVLATGVADILPPVEGVAERWGKTALHCPYCHGYEIGGARRIGVLNTSQHSVQQAALVADWGDVIFFSNGAALSADERALLERRDVAIEPIAVQALDGDAPALDGVRLVDGRLIPIDAVFVGAETRPASPLAADLGCAFDDTMMGPIVRTDAVKRTSVAGVYACGDTARAPHSVMFATADGMQAGLGVHRDLMGFG
jgi:thioredoxin reductase